MKQTRQYNAAFFICQGDLVRLDGAAGTIEKLEEEEKLPNMGDKKTTY